MPILYAPLITAPPTAAARPKKADPDLQPQLAPLYTDAFRLLAPKRIAPPVDVYFYPYAGLNHTIRLRAGRLFVRISDVFKDAPPGVQRALAFILVAKLLRKKVPELHNRTYRDYAFAPDILRASELARRRRGRKIISGAKGAIYDLNQLFARVNREHFAGEIEKPVLSWSRTRTRRILGHHDATHNTVIISKTLDSMDVPRWFVEYILFHELLHIKHPARIVGNRRLHHTRSFRLEEARHPFYQQAQDWLENIARLRRREMNKRAA